MEVFLKGVSFHGVMLDEVFCGPYELKKTLHNAIAQRISAGVVQPLPRTVFPYSEVEQAFRYSCHDGDRLDSNCKD
jgi:fatty acid synthase